MLFDTFNTITKEKSMCKKETIKSEELLEKITGNEGVYISPLDDMGVFDDRKWISSLR